MQDLFCNYVLSMETQVLITPSEKIELILTYMCPLYYIGIKRNDQGGDILLQKQNSILIYLLACIKLQGSVVVVFLMVED